EDATENQPIDASAIVDEKGKRLEEPNTEDPSGEMKNMSDTIDFMPKPRSYWM
ncbi:MAG: hypothetical protein HRT96_09460, partial [Moritella sp.]|nr:hypothetical protein [Moritella sp.]